MSGRAPDATCCPSEVARELGGEDWRDLMPRIRRVAVELTRQRVIEIRQRGRRIDPEDFSGPIRLGCPTTR
ncbi:DUF3253 domain-containing protein [Salinisphaera sp.]|uniref:DUF3253 domain-containing protein n=1 Tax=Salinisphaera sp. TaxID=1914330 RepID=UPI003C799273